MATRGVHHVGLNVLDVDEARDFFVEALGFDVVGGRPEYPAIFVSDGLVMLTLWQAPDPSETAAFDRKGCVGLHHLALRVESLEALQDAHARLASRDDVEVEFAPEALGGRGAQHMVFAGPSGVRLELVWVPA